MALYVREHNLQGIADYEGNEALFISDNFSFTCSVTGLHWSELSDIREDAWAVGDVVGVDEDWDGAEGPHDLRAEHSTYWGA